MRQRVDAALRVNTVSEMWDAEKQQPVFVRLAALLCEQDELCKRVGTEYRAWAPPYRYDCALRLSMLDLRGLRPHGCGKICTAADRQMAVRTPRPPPHLHPPHTGSTVA